jgi:Mg-chelatase subunit ChlD
MNRLFVLTLFVFLFWPGLTSRSKQEPAKFPRTIGLVVDNSGSLRSRFSSVIEVGKAIVGNSDAGEKIFLVRFVSVDKIQIIADIPSAKSSLIKGLDEMYVEGGLSAITDALFLSAKHLIEVAEDQKRALVLITDGAEESSFYKKDQLLSILRERDIRVFIVAFPRALSSQGTKVEERARKYINSIAEQSGGRAYFPATDDELSTVARSVLNDIRSR